MSGIDSIGGRKVVDRDPEATEPERVLVLAIDRMVRIEPVGDWVSDRSGTVTERSSTSLGMLSAWRTKDTTKTHQIALTQRTRSLADSAPNRSTPSL